MPWPEPVRRFESPEDRELRAELTELLGYRPAQGAGPVNFFGAKPTPELIALAEKLRAEAQRRRNTARRRPVWLLAAAGLPIALALTGLGTWGVQQKRKAEAAAAAVQAMEERARHAKEASEAELHRSREHGLQQGGSLQLAAAPGTARPATEAQAKDAARKGRKRLDPYPVIPVERGVVPGPAGTTPVKTPQR
jgi:hypothetical protein